MKLTIEVTGKDRADISESLADVMLMVEDGFIDGVTDKYTFTIDDAKVSPAQERRNDR